MGSSNELITGTVVLDRREGEELYGVTNLMEKNAQLNLKDLKKE